MYLYGQKIFLRNKFYFKYSTLSKTSKSRLSIKKYQGVIWQKKFIFLPTIAATIVAKIYFLSIPNTISLTESDMTLVATKREKITSKALLICDNGVEDDPLIPHIGDIRNICSLERHPSLL